LQFACFIMKFTLLLLLGITGLTAAAEFELPKSVPQVWRDEIFADQSQNIPSRVDEIHDASRRNVEEVQEYLVPVKDIEFAASKTLTPEELKEFFVRKGKKEFLRVYVPAGNDKLKTARTKLRKKYGEPHRLLAGTRIQGKATYHVWDPAKPDGEAFRLKMFYYGLGSEGRPIHHNNFQGGIDAIRTNDWLTEIEKRSPIEGATFYREIFAAQIKGLGTNLNFLIRRPPPAAYAREEGRLFLPLHGVLSSNYVQEFAAAQNRTPQEWIFEEYLPKLAKFTALTNVTWGVWIEAHSQNLSVLVDRFTGKIIQIYFKDLADIMMSPFLQAIHGVLPAYEHRPQALLNENWLTADADDEYAGAFSGDFLLSSITNWTKNKTAARKSAARFIKEYQRQLPGAKLSNVTRHYLKAMEAGRDPMVRYNYNVKSERPRPSEDDYIAAFIHIVDDLMTWDNTTRRALVNFPKLLTAQVDRDLELKLHDWTLEQMEKEMFSWAFKEAHQYYKSRVALAKRKEPLRLIPVHNGVMAVSEGGYFFGLAYGFNAEQLEEINKAAELLGTASISEERCEESLKTVQLPSQFFLKPVPDDKNKS
jgi:hypothetical protein